LIKATRLAISGVLLFVVMSGMADVLYKATDYDAGGTKESFKQDETQVYWQLCRRRRVWHRSSPFI